MKKAKRIVNYLKNVENLEKDFELRQALEAIKDYSTKAPLKFDESVDAQVILGVDSSKGDQVVKSTVTLPHGTGRKVRVIVFAEGDDIEKARNAGAIEVGAEDLIDKVKNGFMDFDKCISTPAMMKKIASLAKILGPRGLMPNPKLGTVSQDVAEATKSIIGGKIEYRTGKDPVVRVSVGRASFAIEKLEENIKELISSIKQAKPATVKGSYIIKLHLSTTMSGFSVKVPASLL